MGGKAEINVTIQHLEAGALIKYKYIYTAGKKTGHSTPGLFGDWKDYED
jgi:hypothetical protein